MKPIPTETATDVGDVGKWLGAAAAGALLMYLFDPDRGPARRSRAASAVRDAGRQAGDTVDHALHSAGDRLADLKDSATNALARGAGRLHRQAAPVLERVERSARTAAARVEEGAERARERVGRHAPDRPRAEASHNTYEANRHYDAAEREDRHDANAALLGGSVLGMLAMVRRSPTGLLVGLAGLALLLRGTRSRKEHASALLPPASAERKQRDPGGYRPQETQAGNQYLH
jgi:hypothetical protein